MIRRRVKSLSPIALASAATLLSIPLASVQADIATVSMSGPRTFSQQDGAAIYQNLCQGCHMPDGQGAVGAAAFPALAKNPKLAAAAYPVYTVIQGRKGMPPLAVYLSDAQVAAVVTYVRTHFGNSYKDKVSVDLVKQARAAQLPPATAPAENTRGFAGDQPKPNP
jgi:mono/diheme cytochrome c family protein